MDKKYDDRILYKEAYTDKREKDSRKGVKSIYVLLLINLIIIILIVSIMKGVNLRECFPRFL